MYSGSNVTALHPASAQDSDYDMSDDDNSAGDLMKPWLAEYQRYINTRDVVPEGMSLVEWWGVSLKSFKLKFKLRLFGSLVELQLLSGVGFTCP